MSALRSGAGTAWVLTPVVMVVLLTGCGSTEPTAALSPLSARLAQIDESVAAQQFEQARRDLTALAAQTKASRADGELSWSRADAILDAIAALRAALPAPAPAATPTPTPTPIPTTAPDDDDDRDEPGKGKEPAGKSKPGGKKPTRD